MSEVAPFTGASPLESEGIFSRRWEPASTTGTIGQGRGIYLLHGTGEHCARYDELASHLTNDGWVVGAHDHVGHGQSFGQRGLLRPADGLTRYAVPHIQQFAKELGAPPILFGHSLGGLLAAELVLNNRVDVRALILSAPAFRPWISWSNRLKLNVMHALAPDRVMELAYRPELLTRDAEMVQAAKQDELIHGFKSARLVRWLFDTGSESIQQAQALSVPTLVLIAKQDPVVDPAAIREWIVAAPEHLVDTIEYAEGLHELFNETPDVRTQITKDLLQWITGLDNDYLAV